MYDVLPYLVHLQVFEAELVHQRDEQLRVCDGILELELCAQRLHEVLWIELLLPRAGAVLEEASPGRRVVDHTPTEAEVAAVDGGQQEAQLGQDGLWDIAHEQRVDGVGDADGSGGARGEEGVGSGCALLLRNRAPPADLVVLRQAGGAS